MVCLQAALSPEEKVFPGIEDFHSKKRKSRDGEASAEDNWFAMETKFAKADEKPDIELHLDTPLPLEWQRCLDIKSGQIHFYNTRTQKRTSKDPRLSPEPPSPQVSLDLELNLACEPPKGLISDGEDGQIKLQVRGISHCNSNDNSGGDTQRSSPWMSLNADRQEMVATVCMRCHMLVMMCKATLSCPNCKFVHPPNQSSSALIKPAVNLLCCRE